MPLSPEFKKAVKRHIKQRYERFKERLRRTIKLEGKSPFGLMARERSIERRKGKPNKDTYKAWKESRDELF